MASLTLAPMTYPEKFETVLLPFWQVHARPGTFSGAGGKKISYQFIPAKDARGAVVLANGQGESYLKYIELIHDLHAAGYAVYAYDHRGQGFSERLTSWSPQICHIDHFSSFVDDLHTFISSVVRPAGHSRVFLFAHSFGGGIGATFLETYPHDVEAAVLTAPLLGVDTRGLPKPFAWLIASGALALGMGDRYVPGAGPYQPNHPHDDWAGTSDQERYDTYERLKLRHPEIAMGGISNRWLVEVLNTLPRTVRRAERVRVPVLLFQAEDDRYVLPRPQERFCEAVPDCKLEVAEGARHEIWFEHDEIRLRQLGQIVEFFASH